MLERKVGENLTWDLLMIKKTTEIWIEMKN